LWRYINIDLTPCNYVFSKLYLFLYMQTLEIKVPDNKTRLVKEVLKEFGVTVKIKKGNDTPNADTIAAMDELKAGKGKKFKNVEELFNSI